MTSTAAAVPGGVGADVAGLLQARDVTPPIFLFSILTAMALGAAHALTPGHGKTIMAAYLVGTRGTPRHALALGLTVTASHTLGVLLLAVVILSVSRITPVPSSLAQGGCPGPSKVIRYCQPMPVCVSSR